MYNIFNGKSKKYMYLEEGEPPPKKLVTEGDILIKKLSENQLKTNITLSEYLNSKKQFTSSETYTDITAHIKGKTNLENFQYSIADVHELNKLKSKGLSSDDIQIYKDFIQPSADFWLKYKNINKDALQQRLNEILQVVNNTSHTNECKVTADISRHQEEYLNSLKPESIETKLLKFATKNKSKLSHLASPMDELPNMEAEFMYNVKEFSKCDIKKIRKKARALGNKVKDLKTVINSSDNENKDKLHSKTQWDVKEKPKSVAKKVAVIAKNKVYTCTPQNWYTIKDGKIIKLNKDKTILQNTNVEESISEKSKLTLDEIKNIAKFSNYEAGSPSQMLFLKNLRNRVTEDFLARILGKFQRESYVIKIMKGKMKGQAFVEFHDEVQASEGLEILNGVLVEGQPIVAQFGKKKIT